MRLFVYPVWNCQELIDGGNVLVIDNGDSFNS